MKFASLLLVVALLSTVPVRADDAPAQGAPPAQTPSGTQPAIPGERPAIPGQPGREKRQERRERRRERRQMRRERRMERRQDRQERRQEGSSAAPGN